MDYLNLDYTNEEIEQLIEKYAITKRQEEEIYKLVWEATFKGKKPVENPSFNIIMGQTGSGKTYLTSYSLQTFGDSVNVGIIDGDLNKKYHPKRDIIAKEHPSIYNLLVSQGSYARMNRIIKEASENKYNFVVEIAPSTERGLFVDLRRLKLLGYDNTARIMATGYFESLLSVHERFLAELLRGDKNARLTEIARHEDSFYSIKNLIYHTELSKTVDTFEVFARGIDSILPTIINSTDEQSKYYNRYPSTINAMDEQRDLSDKKISSKFLDTCDYLEQSYTNLRCIKRSNRTIKTSKDIVFGQ